MKEDLPKLGKEVVQLKKEKNDNFIKKKKNKSISDSMNSLKR